MINLERLHEYPIVAPDVETTGLHWYRDEMFSIAIAVWDGEKILSGYWDLREKPRIRDLLASELPKCRGRVVNHNLKFDAHFLREQGIHLPMDRIECTSVRAALINEHEHSFSLDHLGKKYAGMGKVDIYQELAALFGGPATREAQMKNLHRAPVSLAGKYATVDPEIAIKLWLWQEKEIEKQDLHKVWELEKALTPVLIDMEQHGVAVDEERAHSSMGKIDIQVATAQSDLDMLAGGKVNANSPLQMRKLFGVHKRDDGKWYTDSGRILETTEGGEGSMNKDLLMALAEAGDKRASAAMTLRRMIKAKSFLKDHIIGHAVGGRVYPNYNQTRGDNDLGTGTGRFSVNDPALQQIPARDKDVAAIVRACFIPDHDSHEWASADWEQFEFRWFAHYTNDPNIIKVYHDNPNADYHKVVSDLTGIPRNPRFAGDANAKQINLGLVFGMGQGKMASEMGLPFTVVTDGQGREWLRAGPEAIKVFEKYHSEIPGVSKLLSEASSIARSRGYVQTKMGRHIRFPGGKFTHKAAGLVFQGTSADCMKQKMVELHPVCKKMGFPMLLSVHDELNFSVPKSESKEIAALVKESLETFDGVRCPIECRIPILSSVAIGPNWYEASK